MRASTAVVAVVLLQLRANAFFIHRPVFPPLVRKDAASSVAHAFYYPWYGNPTFDGRYKQWNHDTLPHTQRFRNYGMPSVPVKFSPPDTIASRYMPNAGLHSCRDPAQLRRQFGELKRAHVPVIAVSWTGPSTASGPARKEADEVLATMFDTADDDGNIKIAFQLEIYEGRTAESVAEDIKYLVDTYGQRSGFHRDTNNKQWFYVRDSYQIPAADWHSVLGTGETKLSLRKAKYNSVVMGMWFGKRDGEHILHSGFDGFYTGLATQGASFGASASRFRSMVQFAREHKLLSAPTVGPGHDDLKIRPWNRDNFDDRLFGRKYDFMFGETIRAFPDVVTIASFNGWTEGTQIESARPGVRRDELGALQIDDYGVLEGPFIYLDKTRRWVEELEKAKHKGMTDQWGALPYDRAGSVVRPVVRAPD